MCHGIRGEIKADGSIAGKNMPYPLTEPHFEELVKV